MLKKGDKIRGTRNNPYNQTGYGMLEAEILDIKGIKLVLGINVHVNPAYNGTQVEVNYAEGYFELISKPLVVEKIISDARYIIIDNKYTICIPESVPYGISMKDDADIYNEEMGNALALYRTVLNSNNVRSKHRFNL